jgi:metal-sulfur cluster biosynthetic enzyme
MTEKQQNKVTWQLDNTDPVLAESLRDALREIYDPEIGLNIIQLGLIRDAVITNDEAKITMILTTPFCPYAPALLNAAREKAASILKIPTTIEMGMEMWGFSMMDDDVAPDWGLF